MCGKKKAYWREPTKQVGSSGDSGSLNMADKQQMSEHYNGFAIMIALGFKKLILTLYF